MIKEVKLEKAVVYKDKEDGKYYISVTYTYDAEDGTHELTYPKVDFPLSIDSISDCYYKILSNEATKKISIKIDKLIEPKERLNCRFVVTNINGYSRVDPLTIGKIYKVVDGKFMDNGDVQYPLYTYLHSWEDLVKYLGKDGAYSSYSYSILKIVD